MDCSEKHNKPSSPSSAGRILSFWSFCQYVTNLPQIATYFAGIMPVASRYRLCQLLCWHLNRVKLPESARADEALLIPQVKAEMTIVVPLKN